MIFLLASLSFGQELPAYADLVPKVPSFQTAKKRMYTINTQETLYCGCVHDWSTPDLASCGLSNFTGTRWERTEAEHVVPASVIGKDFSCWDEGGRNYCIKNDPLYKSAHNDLHNLYPAIGQINLYRSNNSMGLIAEEDLAYGCDFEVDLDADRIEPRPEVRGDIARIYFYMEWMHGVDISDGQRRLFMHWHQTDATSDVECLRDDGIEAKQGNANPFVASTCP